MDNVSHSEHKFQAKQPRRHKALVRVGRFLAPTATDSKEMSDDSAARYGKKIISGAAMGVGAVGAVTGLALGAKISIEDQQGAPNYRNRVAACATAIEGHPVKFAIDGDGNPIIPVGADGKVIAACEDANGNVQLAEHALDPTPLPTNEPATDGIPVASHQYGE